MLSLAGCATSPGDEPAAARANQSPAATAAGSSTANGSPATDEPAVAIVWGLERPRRAARRLRRDPAVAAATPVGRGSVLLRAGVAANGRVVQRARSGYAIPLDVLEVHPRPYARTVPPADRQAFSRLRHGTAILSRTAARLRRLGSGGVLRLADGWRLRVIAVVDDATLRDAEVALAYGVRRLRALRSTVMVALRSPTTPHRLARRAERGSAARILGGAGPAGPARPATLKVRFGEPAVGLPYGDDWIRLDPRFVRRHIVTRRVPILGAVRCNREMIAPLRAALGELRRRSLAHLIHDYAGCFAPRRIRPRGPLSLHAWGVAVDLNAASNPFMGRSHQDRRLVDAMERHGFTWGGRWPTRPDPMHFELRR